MVNKSEDEIRKLRGGLASRKRLTRAKAIRCKCLECSCGQVVEVRECHIKGCPLWPYRMGRGEQRAVESE